MDLFYIFIALLLVLLNGFFVAAEFAMVKLRRTRIEAIRKVTGIRGNILGRVHSNLDAYLSACQLGITLASLGLGWIGEPAFARLLEPLFHFAGVTSARLIHFSAFAIAFFIISYLHIVVGELAPKSMAIRRPEAVSLWTAIPLYLFYWGMYPVIFMLNTSANWLLRNIGLDTVHESDHNYSTEELKIILRASRAPGRFTHGEWDMLARSIEFSEMLVRDILKPAAELVVIDPDQTFEENLNLISSERYSRYPMVDRTSGNVIGILHVKDMIGRDLASNEEIKTLLRPPLLVDEQMPAIDLLRDFRKGNSTQFAIVPDLTGILGFVTFDDLLFAFIGNVRDEFHGKDQGWTRLKGGAFKGNAGLPIYSLERILGISIPSEKSGSVRGLIMEHLQRLPEKGEMVDFRQFQIKVLSMKGPRIETVKIIPKPHNE
jgi:CBS domain containing-hemolysin-like protein